MGKSIHTGMDNTGNWNSGDWNSGNGNSGDWNSGNGNSGNWNSGNGNSGDWNSGYWNSGYWNSGYWNSGYGNSGAFNRDCPRMRLFEKDLDITVEEFYEKYDISMDIPLNRWIDKSKMTKEEKAEIDGWETMGGYLKTLDFKEACQTWWDENEDDHQRFLDLPGFDAEIFRDITGIDTNDNGKKQELLSKADELIAKANELKKQAEEL